MYNRPAPFEELSKPHPVQQGGEGVGGGAIKHQQLFYLSPKSSASLASCFVNDSKDKSRGLPFWLSLSFNAHSRRLCGWLHTPRAFSNFDASALQSRVVLEVERMTHTAALLANQKCALFATSSLGLCSPLLLPSQTGAEEWYGAMLSHHMSILILLCSDLVIL
jgi:hypothetical protein